VFLLRCLIFEYYFPDLPFFCVELSLRVWIPCKSLMSFFICLRLVLVDETFGKTAKTISTFIWLLWKTKL